jgi:hypothetical protein
MPSPLPLLALDEFNLRKITIQDIMSSFDREALPSEYRAELFTSLVREQRQRPTEWTITGDLIGTLIQWGVHDEDFAQNLNRMQPEATRSRLFHEKVARRLEGELESYRDIVDDRGDGRIDIRHEVHNVSENLRRIVEESRDRQIKEGRAVRTGLFVDVLKDICERYNLDLSGVSQRTRRSSGSQNEISLFHMLLMEARAEQGFFMLGLLDWLADDHREVLMPHRNTLEQIGSRLTTLDTPTPYRNKFQEILDKLTDSKEDAQGGGDDPPPPSTKGPAGTKRPAAAPSGRRGKRRMGG